MVKQTRQDRLLRLADGRCPVHGIPMVQAGLRGELFSAICPRKDCGIQGTALEAHGPVTLDPAHQELINDAVHPASKMLIVKKAVGVVVCGGSEEADPPPS